MSAEKESQDVFARLRERIGGLERAIAGDGTDGGVEQRVMQARTERVARAPVHLERAPDTLACLLFERCSRRYAVPLASLEDVGPLGSIAFVPGLPQAFLGVTARRGRVVSVVDLPRLFGAAAPEGPRPMWLLMAASPEVVCGVAVDALHDVVDIDRRTMAGAMPTFLPLLQRHARGVLEDRTVVLDLQGLLSDRALRVEERRG